jgi:hypothetical protein
MTDVRDVPFTLDAAGALRTLLGIMLDQGWSGDWDVEHVVALDTALDALWSPDEWVAMVGPERVLPLDIEDVALLLAGMAFTEVASEDLPWIEAVRWTSDFLTAQLRQHWTDDEWQALGGRPGRSH